MNNKNKNYIFKNINVLKTSIIGNGAFGILASANTCYLLQLM